MGNPGFELTEPGITNISRMLGFHLKLMIQVIDKSKTSG
jgi:hypothetical protein